MHIRVRASCPLRLLWRWGRALQTRTCKACSSCTGAHTTGAHAGGWCHSGLAALPSWGPLCLPHWPEGGGGRAAGISPPPNLPLCSAAVPCSGHCSACQFLPQGGGCLFRCSCPNHFPMAPAHVQPEGPQLVCLVTAEHPLHGWYPRGCWPPEAPRLLGAECTPLAPLLEGLVGDGTPAPRSAPVWDGLAQVSASFPMPPLQSSPEG